METRRIQAKLNERGYGPLKVDNNYGDKTTAAVAKFQADHPPLVVDGRVGPKTLAVLFEGAAAVEPTPSAGLMTTSASGRHAISQREGVRLTAYQDSVDVWTIGVGHTAAAGPPSPHAGMTISAAECDAILSRDLATFEGGVLKAVKVSLRQNEFDALVSFAFNVGLGAFAKSTLLKKLNADDRNGAAEQFLKWTKAGGKTLAGLVTRRQSERRQFLGL